MGQVSILEDIQKIKESLASLQGDIVRPPNEMAFKAQERRVEKERQRIAILVNNLSAFIEGIDRKLSSPDFSNVKNSILKKDFQRDLTALNEQRVEARQELAALKKKILGISGYLDARRVFEAKSAAIDAAFAHANEGSQAVLNIIRSVMNKKLRTVMKEYGSSDSVESENKILKEKIKDLKLQKLTLEKNIIDSNEKIASYQSKIKRLQELLSNK